MTTSPALICGIPGTGNSMIAGLLGRHGVPVAIVHYGMRLDVLRDRLYRRWGCDPVAVLPLRDRELHWRRSNAKGRVVARPGSIPHPSHYETPEELHYAHWWPTLLGLTGLSILAVPYAGLYLEPEVWGKRIVRHCGVTDWLGWHEAPRDEDAKWRVQVVAERNSADA